MTRAVHAKTARDAFSGRGAYSNGGRWNTPGTLVAYAAQSASLSILETLVHLENRQYAPSDHVLAYATIPDELVEQVLGVPGGWREAVGNAQTQRVGDDFVRRAETAVLAVPSVIVPSEWNYLLNPAHADFARITIIEQMEPFAFDERLFAS